MVVNHQTTQHWSRSCIDQVVGSCLKLFDKVTFGKYKHRNNSQQKWRFHYIAAVGFSEYKNCEHRLPNIPSELTQLFLWVTNGCCASSQLNGTHYLECGGEHGCLPACQWFLWQGNMVACLPASDSPHSWMSCICLTTETKLFQAHFSTAMEIHKSAVTVLWGDRQIGTKSFQVGGLKVWGG